MPDPFDAYQYLNYLRARWRLPGAVVVAAITVSLIVSLLLPKQYTAHVSMVIEPPAGSDPRAATAVSPIYLESLKTYERFASSDSLFAQAVDRFDLRGGRPKRAIEGLKRQVLKVEVPRNTKILEIAVTLSDPRKAHDAALYLAEETVKMNRKTNRAADEELIAEARQNADAAARRLAEIESRRDRFQRRSPTVDALKAQLDELRSIREEVDRLSLSADLSLVEPEARQKPGSSARAERLRRQAADLDQQIAGKQQMLADRSTEMEHLEAEYDSAWAPRDQLVKRLNDLQGSVGYRGERLNLLDPGVAPERPSSPNVPLNLVVAAALGLIVALFYLTVGFSLESQKAETLRRTLRVASKP